MKGKYPALSIILFCLLACDNPEAPPFKEEASVFAVLFANLESQQVFVYRAHEDVADSLRNEDLFIPDAIVRIADSEREVNFTCRYDSSYRRLKYTNTVEKLRVRPGERYRLTVKTEIGTMTGTTTVPSSICFLAPPEGGCVRHHSEVEVRWRATENAYGYAINLLGPPWNNGFSGAYAGTGRDISTFSTTDTMLVLPDKYITYEEKPKFGWYLEEERRYTVKIMALDRNFKHHLFDGYEVAGVHGGYGLFGSAVVDSLDIYVVK